MFPHTVTVYNSLEDIITGLPKYNITILRGVLLDISKGANVMRSGLANADAAKLYIPMSIEAVSAITGKKQKYIGAKEYERLEDDSEFWTLRTGGSGSAVPCFFVKGEVTEEASFANINNRYDDVYNVTSVDVRDFGSKNMWHWDVCGS